MNQVLVTRSELLPNSNTNPTSSPKLATNLHANRLAEVDGRQGGRVGEEVSKPDHTANQLLIHTNEQNAKPEENQDLPLYTSDVPDFEY